MKTKIIHHVNEDFTQEVIETQLYKNGNLVFQSYSDSLPL